VQEQVQVQVQVQEQEQEQLRELGQVPERAPVPARTHSPADRIP